MKVPTFQRTAGAAPPIRTLLVRLVLAVYLPALLAVITLVMLEARHGRARTEDDLLARTALLSRALHVQVDDLELSMARLAGDIPDDGRDWAPFHAKARQVLQEAGLDGIVLVDAGGQQIVNTDYPAGAPLPVGRAGISASAMGAGRPVLRDAWYDASTGRLLVGVEIPVIRGSRVAYSLQGNMAASRLQSLLSAAPEGWISAIVDANGVIIARTPHPEALVGRPVPAEFLQQLRTEKEGVFPSVTLDNVESLTAFRKPPALSWTVVLNVPRSKLYAPVWAKAAILAAGAVSLLGIGVWGSVRLRRAIVGSVEALASESAAPPLDPQQWPLAFEEANELRRRLRASATRLRRAQEEVDRANASAQRKLLQQMDRRQAEIAGELHDNVGSTLAGASMLLARARHSPAPDAAPLLERAQSQLDLACAGLRRVSRGIMPAGEQHGALPVALDQLAADAALGGVKATFRSRGDFSSVPPDVASHVYRIAQEAATNAMRHGTAMRIRLFLTRVGDQARLAVDDDGAGFEPAGLHVHPGVGLRSMRARAQAIDGTLAFRRSPMGGTRVCVTFPMGTQDERSAEPGTRDLQAATESA